MADLPTHNELIGKKFAGYTVDMFLNAEDGCHWYAAHTDSNERAILYVYGTSVERDAACQRIHGFLTSFDEALDHSHDRLLFAALGAHRVMMPIDLRKLLMDDSTRPSSIGGFIVDGILGFGYKGVTYRVTRENGPRTPYALKLTIAEEYEGTTYLPEVDRMVDVAAADRDHFPQIHSCDRLDFIHDRATYNLVYFVEDFISGTTLETVLEHHTDTLDEMFLYHFIQEALSAIATLQACGLMHDDLHSGNIMLHSPPAGRKRPYLIDFGSAKPWGTTKKARDDIRNLASHIAQIANAVQQNSTARTMHGERVLVACESLLTVIADADPLRRPEDAKALLEHFDRSFQIGSVKQELLHPFDFGNAEEVMDNSLLYSLAAKSFPWQEQISASSHLLVIGPRGCGKTTVFRSMSFVCLADAGHLDVALKKGYLGIYVSCNKEFRLRFSAIDRERLLNQQDEIRHYFHLVVLRELASVLVAMERAKTITAADIKAVASFAYEQIPSAFPTSVIPSALDIEVLATRAVHDVRMALWNGASVDVSTTQGFLADLATLISTRIAPLAGKTLYLFVDDYTEGKVPREAQQALNHVLFVPNASYKCKISSEVFGVIQDEVFQNFLDQDREYKEWNLGTLYCVSLPAKDQKEFLKEIVDNRLELCGYIGRVNNVIGASLHANGTFERTLKAEHSMRQERREQSSAPTGIAEKEVDAAVVASGAAAYYHGWDTICNLCTGDVSNILELLNRMFKECNVKKSHVATIPADHQDSVITGYSRQYISKVKGIPRYGDRLFGIVDAFGSMARRLLEEYPLVSHGEGRNEPYRLLRIELDEAFSGTVKSLEGNSAGDDALELWKLLQRHCIFIDADEGRSRRHTLSSRVILRRIFCPAFRIGLVNSESFTVSQQEWKAFCADPAARKDQYVKKCVQRALEKRGIVAADRQRMLFNESDEEATK